MNTLQNNVIEAMGYEQQDLEDKEGELYISLQDITNHGASGGVGGFVYYNETTEFFDANREAIVKLALEYASEFSMSVTDFVSGFGSLGHDYSVGIDSVLLRLGEHADDTYVKNALAWFALEEAARTLVEA